MSCRARSAYLSHFRVDIRGRNAHIFGTCIEVCTSSSGVTARQVSPQMKQGHIGDDLHRQEQATHFTKTEVEIS